MDSQTSARPCPFRSRSPRPMTRFPKRPVALFWSLLLVAGAAATGSAGGREALALAKRTLAAHGLSLVEKTFLLAQDEEDALARLAEADQKVGDFLKAAAKRDTIRGL